MTVARTAGGLIVLGTVVLLGWAVAGTAAGLEDWLELAAIAAVALVFSVALFQRRLPRRTRAPVIRRTPESRW